MASITVLDHEILIIVWTLTVVATILTVTRVLSRMGSGPSRWGWDDVVVLVAWGLDLGCSAVLSAAVVAVRQVDLAQLARTLPPVLHLDLTANAVAIFSITTPKLATALLIVRTLHPSRLARGLLVGACLALLLGGVVGVAIQFAQCQPVAGQWNPFAYPQTRCWPRSVQTNYSYFLGAYSAVLDLVLALYPVPTVCSLQMSKQKRAAVCVMMGLGMIACAFAIIKTVQISRLDGLSSDPRDLLYVTLITALWSSSVSPFLAVCALTPGACAGLHLLTLPSIETNVILFALCLPSVVYLWRHGIDGSQVRLLLPEKLRSTPTISPSGSYPRAHVDDPSLSSPVEHAVRFHKLAGAVESSRPGDV